MTPASAVDGIALVSDNCFEAVQHFRGYRIPVEIVLLEDPDDTPEGDFD